MFTKLMVGGLTAVVGLMAVVSQTGRALAQYPVPQGSCVIATLAAAVDPHATVTVDVTVLDVNGKPVPGVATEISISRQPGEDAALGASSSLTDVSGAISSELDAGSSAGSIGISAQTDAVSCAATVVVGEGAVLGAVSLPDTGSGSQSQRDSFGALGAFLLGVLGVAAVAAAAGTRARSR